MGKPKRREGESQGECVKYNVTEGLPNATPVVYFVNHDEEIAAESSLQLQKFLMSLSVRLFQ